ncbi:uncharacterized protein LOC130995826 [Salvia miltiorrhiza]|uniref:uncharacterized protein LOC130995826 n=1 Tax=Salvia miltiorrhiza TaxID=226208 RepID=UPI0025ABCA6F|nr:uncharacterized protein LOC130995826 [Salvia miltiorrhiza]
MPATQWDMATNQIHAVDEVWEKIFEDNWLAQAYLRAREPEYNEMCMLFAPNEIKTEISHTLVLISDSPQCKKPSPINLISTSLQEDEVNSPAPPPPKPVVRKLNFNEADDAMSSVGYVQSITPHYYVPWPKLESRLRYPTIENASATRKKPAAAKDVVSPRVGYDSSCASSSPFK